jgi:two-component system, cell cycle response regulator
MKVLIAEDDVSSRMLLKRVLEKWGYEVQATKDGAEAWAVLQDPGAPRLVILDWMMPDIDGVDVCRRVREHETQQPPYIILLTGLGDKESVVTGLNAGANDFVGKPYEPAELRARVEVGRRFVELNDKLAEAQRALEVQARTDGLTGVMNRRAIMIELEGEGARATREHTPLGVGMLDIDHFKHVNDTFGHAIGDIVLREVVRRAAGVLRPYDSLGRFGGEEFLLVVPAVDADELATVFERVRAAVADGPVVALGNEVDVTVSLGGVLGRGEPVDELLVRADDALYAAKEQGRNKTVMAPAA